MTSPYKKIAREARGRLAGHWPSALGVLLLPAAVVVLMIYLTEYLLFCAGLYELDAGLQIFFHPGMLAALAGILLLNLGLMLLVLRPLLLGVQRWWIGLAYGQDLGASVCLWYFSRKHYLPCLKYNLRIALYGLAAALPAAGLFGLLAYLNLRGQPELYTLLLQQGPGALTVAQLNTVAAEISAGFSTSVAALVMLCLPLYPADFLFVTAPGDHIVLRRAPSFMWTHHAAILRFFAVSAGWFFLSSFIFPLVYTLPFLGVSSAVLLKWLTENSK